MDPVLVGTTDEDAWLRLVDMPEALPTQAERRMRFDQAVDAVLDAKRAIAVLKKEAFNLNCEGDYDGVRDKKHHVGAMEEVLDISRKIVRLEKRVLVPLPDAPGRAAMLTKWLADRVDDDVDLAAYADDTDGYSGSDLHLLCKEAAMRPVRRLVLQLETMENKNGGAAVPDDHVDALLKDHKISTDDFKSALKCTNPSAKLFADKYRDWHANFGSDGSA